MNEIDFFRVLNEVLTAIGRAPLDAAGPQRSIIQVRPSDRVLQILAGPGSGKTEMLIWRVLYELIVNATPADQIVVTTFTNRAATELQVRVVERCDEFLRIAAAQKLQAADPQVHNLRIGTIHSLCDQLLTEFDSTYLDAGTQLIDEAETMLRMARTYRFSLGYTADGNPTRLVNRLLDHQQLTALFRSAWDEARWPGNNMERMEFLLALLGQHIETWLPRCAAQSVPNGLQHVFGPEGLTGELVKLQGRWERYLDEQHIQDFPGIQKRFYDRQQMLIGRFQHVFVDEFQDSNPLQFAIHTRWLLNPATRLTVVGDDDQAIYRFRGSDIECFHGLEPHCKQTSVPFRRETLGVNYRSTRAVVEFSQSFKKTTALQRLSLDKHIKPDSKAPVGTPVRLLRGDWSDLCDVVAGELDALGVGRPRAVGDPTVPSVALLIFSTSERQGKSWTAPASVMREAIEKRGLRVYNPRNKTAGRPESPVGMLLGLISYLVDPISVAAAGKGGRNVMVCATDRGVKAAHAKTFPPPFPINAHHLVYQKKFIKAQGGDIGRPVQERKAVLDFVDSIRDALAKVPSGHRARLTLAGFVARLLSLPFFRQVGFSTPLFREALFTQLLEANIAPTRLTRDSLDQPLEVARKSVRYEWPARLWNFLNYFGAYLENRTIDDPDVEAFEEDAVLMITFHQAKGLEFDHVYIAGTGREPDLAPALRTQLFSGKPVKFSFVGDELKTKDAHTLELAVADRDREVYVAATRAKQTLSILYDPQDDTPYMRLNPGFEQLFAKRKPGRHKSNRAVEVVELPCQTT